MVRKNHFINYSELQFSLNGGSGNVKISKVSGDILIGAELSQKNCANRSINQYDAGIPIT